uniref:SWI/SNF-related matrix-associated actin-dependent regulator of chromatin subfamily A-like protein 1 n=1 Tax=Romanomermis culicivorax TaxID=13658 RepID=A0A915J9P0_ROMCU
MVDAGSCIGELRSIRMLTEADKRRIEENRQRALALKAKKATENCGKQNFPSTQASTSTFVKDDKFMSNKKDKFKNFHRKKSNQASNDTNKPIATCVLISRERFEPFAQNSLVSCLDSTRKVWNFPLQSYKEFKEKVGKLSDKMTIKFLPNMVLTAFSAVINQQIDSTTAINNAKIPNYDLRTIDPALRTSLFPFQLEAVNFAISKGGRVLIADDMGMGKTLEALGVASYYRKEWPLLIIAPAAVRQTWINALKQFLSPSHLPHEKIFSPNTGAEVEPCLSRVKDNGVLVVSYDTLKSKILSFAECNFGVVIADESHCIKDHKSERFKAVKAILKNSTRIILLSGTPALSRPVELFTQLQCINRAIFKDYEEFVYRYCDGKMMEIKKVKGGQAITVLDSSGASNLEELEILLRETVMIRRLKDDVLNQLLPKERHVVVLEKSLINLDTKEMQTVRSKFLNEKVTGAKKHGILLQFYNETAQVKLRAVVEHVKAMVAKDRKIVIFAHHQLVLDTLHTELSLNSASLIRIDGHTSSSNRQELCDKFQTNDRIKVALLSITAAGVGLTLTAANLVIFAELFWNPGILLQAEDRVHRVGQESNVEIQYLIAKGTADDSMWELVKHKLQILGRSGLSKDTMNVDSITSKDSSDVKKSKQSCMDDFLADLSAADLSSLLDGTFTDDIQPV